ncbi:MAG: 1-acyl-sn-glycerol-3-phosphate acyltransferase [Chloroflexota bacterium]|nr:1-acyl-sn-glycerol-3-phosphate acyltransferase [Chloroflexota bacterium]
MALAASHAQNVARASRAEIALIVARESAETLIGVASGRRVEAARRLLAPAANVIARRFVEYDRVFAERGTFHGASWIVTRATGGLEVHGAEHVPATGPLLVVANHPGLTDAVALLAALGRDDAWIVTADYPFLHALRRAKGRFLFVRDRRAAFRDIVARLRMGDAVLLFPAGGLEPDPAVSPDSSRDALASWSRSIDLIPRLAPGTRVLPVLVSGAVSRSAFENRIVRRRMPARERQRLASLLQLAVRLYQRHPVRVRFAAPIADSTSDVHAAVVAAMRGLLAEG